MALRYLKAGFRPGGLLAPLAEALKLNPPQARNHGYELRNHRIYTPQ